MEQSSGEVETYLCRDYSPNGSKFIYTIDGINLANGDYIEISADLTNCQYSNENIISLGDTISAWSGKHFHFYFTQSGKQLQANALFSSFVRKVFTLQGNEVIILLNKDGIYVNGELWGQSGQTQYINLMEYLLTVSTISVGSQEGSTRFYGTYNYIKWVKMT